eukprot:gene5796-9617_t
MSTELPKTTPAYAHKTTRLFSTVFPVKLALWTMAPLATFFIYRFQTSYHYESKFKPYKSEVKKTVSDIKDTIKDLRENQKLDLVNVPEEELLSKICASASNKSDCSFTFRENKQEFLDAFTEKREPKLNILKLYARKYVEDHPESGHGHH